MKRKDTMSLGEFRELTKDMPDSAVIMVTASTGYTDQVALAVHNYPFETSLDKQDVILLEPDITNSVCFADY